LKEIGLGQPKFKPVESKIPAKISNDFGKVWTVKQEAPKSLA